MPRNPQLDELAEVGVVFPYAHDFLMPEHRRNYALAMDQLAEWASTGDVAFDAQPSLVSTGNAGVPALFTALVDPEVVRIALAPLAGAKIYGEEKKGDWTNDQMIFPVVEMTGNVSSYGDFNNNGQAGVNPQWVYRQSYFFQTVIQYGERELDRAGAAKINYASELQTSAANALNRFQDFTYHFGVAGLQNYGALNDPYLPAAMTPAIKANGGTRWIAANGTINANPNEVYSDVQALYVKLVNQTLGNIDMNTPMKLVTDPGSSVALTITNNFNVSVRDLLAKNFPNLTFETSPRYATTGGNVVQLIATSFDGAKTGFCAYPEKLRQHKLIPDLSSFKQKHTSGTWGTVIRYPLAVAQLLGV